MEYGVDVGGDGRISVGMVVGWLIRWMEEEREEGLKKKEK